MSLKHCEEGAVMLLVAMLASVLLLLAGLAIDSAVISNSKVQQRHAAEYMALGAIKAFNKESNPDPIQKLNTATARAQQLARENVFLAKSFIKNPSSEVIGNYQSSGTHGNISAGIWYFKEGSGQCNGTDTFGNPISDRPAPCPCKSGNINEWATPCFRELNFSNPSDAALTPNATRVELKTATNSPIQTLFARVKGQETINISSTATAVQLPRRGVFLVDLSRHSHNETHLPFQVASNPTITPYSSGVAVIDPSSATGEFGNPRFAGEYSFLLRAPTSCPISNQCLTTGACTMERGNTEGRPPFGIYTTPPDLFNTVYKNVIGGTPSRITENTRPIASPNTRPTKHYKTDYFCFNVNTHNDTLPDNDPTDSTPPAVDTYSSTSTPGVSYLIDTYYGTTNTGQIYDGPEPLNTMLIGVQEGINKYKENIIPGDEITVLGFDGSASIDLRTIGPVPIDTTNSTFQELENLSQIELAGDPSAAIRNQHFNNRFVNHLFFPRVDNDGMDKQKNVVEALKRAKEVLISGGSTTSENFVVLISDGISSCFESTDTSLPEPKRCSAGNILCSVCSNSYAGFMNSFAQAEKIITEEYVPNNIKFHFVQIGLRSAPHTLQRVKTITPTLKECMSVDDMDAQNPPLSSIDPTFDAPVGGEEDEFKKTTYGGLAFPQASDFGRLAKESKGKYLPLRKPCQAGVDNTANFNNECNTLSPINDPLLGITPPAEERVNGLFSDSRGRVTCDISGKNRRQQMRDAISEIFNEDPYIIVD